MRPERRRAGLARAVALAGALGLALPAFALELGELMSTLAARRSGEAAFVERRFVPGFDAPLQASGTLAFAAPDRFVRRTLQPRAEAMEVDGNRVTLTRGGRSRTLMLDAAPEALVAVEAVRATLTGNAALLQRYFEAKVGGDLARWTLVLRPLDPAAAAPLRAVHIVGQRDELRVVETELSGGERTVMTIEPLRARR